LDKYERPPKYTTFSGFVNNKAEPGGGGPARRLQHVGMHRSHLTDDSGDSFLRQPDHGPLIGRIICPVERTADINFHIPEKIDRRWRFAGIVDIRAPIQIDGMPGIGLKRIGDPE